MNLLRGCRVHLVDRRARVYRCGLEDYAPGLNSMTTGEGTYTMDLSHYEATPPRRQDELCAAFKPVHDEDD